MVVHRVAKLPNPTLDLYLEIQRGFMKSNSQRNVELIYMDTFSPTVKLVLEILADNQCKSCNIAELSSEE